jgi:hypothetical protein
MTNQQAILSVAFRTINEKLNNHRKSPPGGRTFLLKFFHYQPLIGCYNRLSKYHFVNRKIVLQWDNLICILVKIIIVFHY